MPHGTRVTHFPKVVGSGCRPCDLRGQYLIHGLPGARGPHPHGCFLVEYSIDADGMIDVYITRPENFVQDSQGIVDNVTIIVVGHMCLCLHRVALWDEMRGRGLDRGAVRRRVALRDRLGRGKGKFYLLTRALIINGLSSVLLVRIERDNQ